MKTNLSVLLLLFGLAEISKTVIIENQTQQENFIVPPKSDSIIKGDKPIPKSVGAHKND